MPKKEKEIVISVMLPTKNREKSIREMLDTLKSQSLKNFELVAVDGGSTDKTEEIVKSYDKYFPVQWHVKTGGLIPQMNVAYQNAKGKYVVRTDDDVKLSNDWLKSIVEVFESDKKVGGVTGPTVIPDKYAKSRDLFYFEEKLKNGNLFWKLLGKIYYGYFMEGQPYRVSHWFDCGTFSLGNNFSTALNEKRQEVNNLEACNWAVRKDLLVKAGGFDPAYLGIGEYHEPDASFKIRNLGYKLVFDPKVSVNHCPSTEGFFKDRPSAYPRMLNFCLFYFRHIRKNLSTDIRFFSYLLFINLYFVYQAVTRKQLNLLGSIPGTGIGIIRALRMK